MADNENSLAVFVDFENLALGFEGRRGPRFEIQKVLERLVEKGKIIVKRAYADWGRFREYRSGLHEAAIELIEIPRRSMTGKNSADIRLVVDAMDLSYSKAHVDTFVIISGDSDFSPLVSKLKENGKQVIGIGMKSSTSDLLVDNCDEFIFYEDLDRPAIAANTAEMVSVPTEKKKLFSLVMEALAALRRENKEVIWSSMVKDTIKRKRPQFNETYYGYRSFSNVLEDAQRFGLVSLTTDPRSGTYVVSESGREVAVPSAGPANGGGQRDSRRDENGGREDRWGRRRGRRGGRDERRWDDRREPVAGNGEAIHAAGAEGAPSISADEGMNPVEGHTDSGPRAVYEPQMEMIPADTVVPSYRADDRDEYGFPRYQATAAEPMPEARDMESEIAEDFVPTPGDDDRTPEEREMDARAEALAQSRPTTDSPSKTRGGTRGPRTGTRAAAGAAAPRGGRRTAAAGTETAPAPRRGRAAAGGTTRTPATGGTSRTRRGAGSTGTRTRTPRKSS
jgi:uncharacterized protein (TIGR00288 family)